MLNQAILFTMIHDLEQVVQQTPKKQLRWQSYTARFPKSDGSLFSKDEVIEAYRTLAGQQGLQPCNPEIIALLKKKPVRTQSGVTPLTVLTKPFPCPGKCIFCPNDVRMPKSYLSDEPGAQRAERNYFDPYLQTYNRLQALHNIGHLVDKTELIILGGTWSYYPEAYQVWFIKECLRALNEFGVRDDRTSITQEYARRHQELQQHGWYAQSDQPAENKIDAAQYLIDGQDMSDSYNRVISKLYTGPEKLSGYDKLQSATWEELVVQQHTNETAAVRCVGLVIETRPDNISEQEVLRIRRLGCTKTQIGVQSLQDDVLRLNHRGHDVAATRRAFRLLRQAGLKIHAHWMANLYGSSVEQDIADYQQLFSDPDFRPDELKIYPCSLIASAELMAYHQKGLWQPYTEAELLQVLQATFLTTPPYCRLTRVIRDIPSQDIVVGNKKTNFRQLVDSQLTKLGKKSVDIRAREIKDLPFDPQQVVLDEVRYETSVSQEIFLQFITPDDHLVAFLRLSLPSEPSFIAELQQAAIVREVHVYGTTQSLGKHAGHKPQHLGFGTRLLKRAAAIAQAAHYTQLAVISSVGTREYYRGRGFVDGELYQHQVFAKTADSPAKKTAPNPSRSQAV